MAAKFGHLTLLQLQKELKKRSAKTSGRKHELVERLDAYDRNANFGQPDVTGVDFQMTLPPITDYQDLHEDKQFVKINMDQIHRYLGQFDKKLDVSSQNLYCERFLLYVRCAVENDVSFIKSSCRAEMKKAVTYSIDVAFDRNGFVIEAQCECAAGMGPHAHCKHVNAVLCAVFDFSTSGSINVEETCTQKLQTFHHAKRFKGSPLKARDLQMPGANKGTLEDFDPRPKQFRNMPGYSDYFRNTCLNTAGISSTPIFQLFPPANSRAVAHDHDYFALSPVDQFFKDITLSSIDNDTIREIETTTQGQNCTEWYSEREKRITSSNFGRICKATDRTNFGKLSRSLTKSSDLKVPAILHGKKYEGIAIGNYMRLKKRVVKKCGLCVSKDFPYLAASPDGVVGSTLLVEVKCPFVAKDKEISNITVPYLKMNQNDQLHLDTHHNYYYQIQGQMLCTGLNECDFVVYTLRDLKVLRIVRDEVFIGQMVSKLTQFYKDFHRCTILDKMFYKCDR